MQIDILNFFQGLGIAMIYLGASFLLFFIGKLFYQLLHKGFNIDHELVEKDNLAFSVAHIGYYISLIIVIAAVFSGEALLHVYQDLIEIGIYGIVSILLLNISIWISDRIILRKFQLKKQIIDDQNLGLGLVEGAICIANGLVIYGVLVDNSDHFWEMLLLWAIAQIILGLITLVYNKITPYDIYQHIHNNNAAVGIGFAGAIIAVANLARFGAQMPANTWIAVGENFLLETGIGLLMLPLVRFLTDKILLPKRRLVDEIVHQEKPNHGAALLEAFSYISGSILICLSFS